MMIDYSQKEKAVAATTIFKMKIQHTMEMIEDEHLQDTFGAEMIFEGEVYEEDEEIHMEDLEQTLPKFKAT